VRPSNDPDIAPLGCHTGLLLHVDSTGTCGIQEMQWIDRFFWSDAVLSLLVPSVGFACLAFLAHLFGEFRLKNSRSRTLVMVFAFFLGAVSAALFFALLLDLWRMAENTN
jgi:hypothetical protein